MRYVQSMYYRDWTLSYRVGMNISASQTVSIQVPLYTASMAPISSLSNIDHLDLFLFVRSNVPVRISYSTVSGELRGSRGVVKLTIPGASLPSAIVPMFGNMTGARYYMLYVNVTNLSSTNGRFSVPHYEALVDYQSNGVPNPYYHGTDPEQGGYIMPGDALWSTRFIYRGRRSAFSFLVLSQCVGQALARSKTAMTLPSIRNYGQSGGGVGFIHLVWSINRLNRALGWDGVLGGV